jgi:hypothetical protein
MSAGAETGPWSPGAYVDFVPQYACTAPAVITIFEKEKAEPEAQPEPEPEAGI